MNCGLASTSFLLISSEIRPDSRHHIYHPGPTSGSNVNILRNINHFNASPDLKKIEDFCITAHLTPVLKRLKRGLYTQLSSAATLLSASEKQQLFLVGALYLEAQTLILDEFTGNLDTETEIYIFQNLRALGKTVIMTVHRESTINEADRIFSSRGRKWRVGGPQIESYSIAKTP